MSDINQEAPNMISGIDAMRGVGQTRAKGFWADAWGRVLKRNGARVNAGALRGLLAKGLPVEPRVRVIESRRISVHADLCLVRCDDVEYVILCSAQQQQVLREQPTARRADA